jgi:hypothetical protein
MTAITTRVPWTSQPQTRVQVNRAIWPGKSQVFLPSLQYAGVIGGVETLTADNPNAPFSIIRSKGRVFGYRPNSSTSFGEAYKWITGDIDIGPDGSMIWFGEWTNTAYGTLLDYGGASWGLSLQVTTTTAVAQYVDNPTSAAYTATLSGVTIGVDYPFAIGLTKKGNTIRVFFNKQSASTSSGNGGIRRSAGSGIGYNSGSAFARTYLSAVTSTVLSDSAMFSVLDNPWQLFAPQTRRIWGPSAGAGGVPTLSASTYVPGSLTSTGWRPQITAS